MQDWSDVQIEEKAALLFQPDTLVGSQYLESLSRKEALDPDKKLMLAVLEDGIQCFQANIEAREPKNKKLFSEAENWILEERNDAVFSFENICEVLELNPQYVRQGVLGWKQQRQTEAGERAA